MAENTRSRAADPAAAVMFSGENSTEYSTRAQIFNIDGERLPSRRRLPYGAPRLAQPGWYRLAAARWLEVAR